MNTDARLAFIIVVFSAGTGVADLLQAADRLQVRRFGRALKLTIPMTAGALALSWAFVEGGGIPLWTWIMLAALVACGILFMYGLENVGYFKPPD